MLNSPTGGIPYTKQQKDQVDAVAARLSYLIDDVKVAETKLKEIKEETARSENERLYQHGLLGSTYQELAKAQKSLKDTQITVSQINDAHRLKEESLTQTERNLSQKRIALDDREKSLKASEAQHAKDIENHNNALIEHKNEKQQIAKVKSAFDEAAKLMKWK